MNLITKTCIIAIASLSFNSFLIGQKNVKALETIKELKKEWPTVYKNSFEDFAPLLKQRKEGKIDEATYANKIRLLSDQWLTYQQSLVEFVKDLSLTHYFSRSTQQSLENALEILHDNSNLMTLTGINPAQVQASIKDRIKALNGLSSKYNLGKLARVGDEHYIKELKSLLADQMIPNIVSTYQKASS
jgi:hypothetical protein